MLKAIENANAAFEKSRVAEKTEILVGDVARFENIKLPKNDFAFDIGRFHLLNQADQEV